MDVLYVGLDSVRDKVLDEQTHKKSGSQLVQASLRNRNCVKHFSFALRMRMKYGIEQSTGRWVAVRNLQQLFSSLT